MAGMVCNVQTAEIALAAATAKTVLQIVAPTNQRLKLKRWGVFFDGVSATAEPVQVRVLRQTTAIGGTPTAVTPQKYDGLGSETPQATAAASAGGTEPTAGAELDCAEVHPQQGWEVAFGDGEEIIVPGGGRVGIEVTAAAIVNVRGKFRYEE